MNRIYALILFLLCSCVCTDENVLVDESFQVSAPVQRDIPVYVIVHVEEFDFSWALVVEKNSGRLRYRIDKDPKEYASKLRMVGVSKKGDFLGYAYEEKSQFREFFDFFTEQNWSSLAPSEAELLTTIRTFTRQESNL